jgi:FlaA1/EpsC-like NDP-sugar epimerase
MTIPEASQLIMQAGVMGQGGEIFVLDMGEPIKINYLAEQLIRLSGKVPKEDIEITYTGLRPGEKLYEELFHDMENLQGTNHEKILLAQSRHVDWEEVVPVLQNLNEYCVDNDEKALRETLCNMVPEMCTEKVVESAIAVPLRDLEKTVSAGEDVLH